MPQDTSTVALASPPRRPLARRVAHAVAALAAASLACSSLAVGPASADSCPNAAARAASGSTGLPDCRAYELASPPFKEGFEPQVQGYTDDGEALTFQSAGNFAGNGLGGSQNQYLATRGATGWSSIAVAPSGPTYAIKQNGNAEALSADLRSSLWLMSRADQPSEVADFYRRRVDGIFTRIGPSANPATLPPSSPGVSTAPAVDYVGASADLSHVIFALKPVDVYPGTIGATNWNLYEYVGAGGDRPHLVAVDNAGDQVTTCDMVPGSHDLGAAHAISSDGRVIFWSSFCTSGPEPAQVWARVGGTTTIQASASECTRAPGDPGGACNAPAAAEFQGADADGSRVLFTTTQQLVDGDTDGTADLYACDIPAGTPAPSGLINPCAALHEVSNGVTGADVEGVTRMSDDGSRVYFVAHGVLATNLGANDTAAVAGNDNLYVWRRDAVDPGGETTFVGALDPGDSGSLWGADRSGRMAQTSDDGRYLVFSTRSPLVSSGPNADTDSAADVYRYDVETGALVRLSTTTAGDGGNEPGLDATFAAVQYALPVPTLRSRTAMSADAGTVVFQTDEALAPGDSNGSVDTYAWHDGQVSLISSGRSSLDGTVGVFGYVTASGRDIFFSTTAKVSPDDADTVKDIYDARVDGGISVPQPVPCADDACQEERGAPPTLAGSASDAPGAPGDTPAVAPSFSFRAVSAAERRSLAATGRLTLEVTTNASGTVSVTGTAAIARKSVKVTSARRTVAASGKASLTLALSKAARTRLAADGKLTVKLVVTHSKVAITRSTTLSLVHAKAKKATSKRATTKRSASKRAASTTGKEGPS
ncbi:MAG: hypothetical protein JWQ18_1011 [Conexibacter sp.]|nr:hypothetical protein [Conexibacter sp.]